MPRKTPPKLWVTYRGSKEDPLDVEVHEDERRAALRTLQDPSRKEMQMEADLAKRLAEPPFKMEKTEFLEDEYLQEVKDKKPELELTDDDFYWVTYRIAKGKEDEKTISRPGYYQFHKTQDEAIAAANQRTTVSHAIKEGYSFGVLFAVKDERIFNGGVREGVQVGAPEKPEDQKLNKRWAFYLTKPILERFKEYEEKRFLEDPKTKRAEVLRELVEAGKAKAEAEGKLPHIPILAEEGLNQRDTSEVFAHRVNEADNEDLKAFMKANRVRNKQDLITRLIFNGLMSKNMPIPRGFPTDPDEY